MAPVTGATGGTSGGKRAGSRRGQRPKRRFQPVLLGLSLGVTACIVAWGYLVVAAIDFGTSARGGESAAWWFLALASAGAVACLFVGLMLIARILRRLGITSGPLPRTPKREATASPTEPRPAGGRRAKR